ncbi:hypothetical protein [Emticicia sp. SJ17W-69]|uniref:hypothetical protein n=1 Tax=Emticicia sp. SJ17W-69 TaxID=3421657 RepID=UPI003EB8A919
MRKKIIEKIYFVLLLTTIFSSSYVMLHDIVSKDKISCPDVDIELLNDCDLSDANETTIVYINNDINESAFFAIFDNFSNNNNVFLYLQNTYEIYLGLNTPPPKYL